MAAKDIVEKHLEEYPDVAADIFNFYYYDGRAVIKPEELIPAPLRTQFKANGVIHEQERDGSFYWDRSSVRLAQLGIENQTVIDPDMVIRVPGYDGASYKEQVIQHKRAASKKSQGKGDRNQEQKRPTYPVVTLTLYFGETHWGNHRDLSESFREVEGVEPEVRVFTDRAQKREIDILEVAFLTPEQVDMFTSDFRIVADYFVQIRTTGKYIPPMWPITHVEETLKLMSVLTGDYTFEKAYNEKKGVIKNMGELRGLWKAEDRAEGHAEGLAEGLAKGHAKGIAEGRSEATREHVLALKGRMTAKEIAEVFSLPLQQVLGILGEMGNN